MRFSNLVCEGREREGHMSSLEVFKFIPGGPHSRCRLYNCTCGSQIWSVDREVDACHRWYSNLAGGAIADNQTTVNTVTRDKKKTEKGIEEMGVTVTVSGNSRSESDKKGEGTSRISAMKKTKLG